MRLPRRQIAGRVALALASIAVSVAVVEGLLRITDKRLHLMGYRAQWLLGRYEAHPTWHHWMRPDSETDRDSFDPAAFPSKMVFHVNAQGCRDRRDLGEPPAAGTKRIIVMGDSFTEGYYEDQTFAAILERRLNVNAERQRFEVFNCGTSSYSPILHYLRFKNQLQLYSPHELIVNIDLTDVYDDNKRYRPMTRFSGNEPLEAWPAAHGWRFLLENLRFRYYVARLLLGYPRMQLWTSTGTTAGIFGYHGRLTPQSAEWRHDVAFSLSMLQRLIDLTRQRNIAITLTMYPFHEQFSARENELIWNRTFEAAVRDLADRNAIPFYSAYDDLRPLFERGIKLYWDDDVHFNPTGQLAWGKAFAEYYVARQEPRAAASASR